MKYFVYLIFLAFTAVLCSCNDDEKESLKSKLVQNVWRQTKIEIYENGELETEIEWPEDPTCGDFLRFQSEQKVSYLSECEDAGCGHWLLDGKTLELIIAADNIVPDLCLPANFQEMFYANDEIEIKNNNTLISTGIGLGLRLLAVQPEYEEWKEKYENGTVDFKCYFIPDNPLVANDVSCCADFDWH